MQYKGVFINYVLGDSEIFVDSAHEWVKMLNVYPTYGGGGLNII